MTDDIRQAALDYHRLPRPGKLAIVATKPLANQHDLALAYTPGVAAACQAIVADPGAAADYTARLALQEEIKGLPWGAVWDHYCTTAGVVVGRQWLDELKEYETAVMSART